MTRDWDSPRPPAKPDAVYKPNESNERWWCETHQRPATYLLRRSFGDIPCCDPALGGILIPCVCNSDTSFPFLKIARDYGVDYGIIICRAELFYQWGSMAQTPETEQPYDGAIFLALGKEKRRRAHIEERMP